MQPDFNVIDEALIKLYLAQRDYQLAKRDFSDILETQGYERHTFGKYETHPDRLIHESVNPHQIYEFGVINEYLDPRLAFDI